MYVLNEVSNPLCTKMTLQHELGSEMCTYCVIECKYICIEVENMCPLVQPLTS